MDKYWKLWFRVICLIVTVCFIWTGAEALAAHTWWFEGLGDWPWWVYAFGAYMWFQWYRDLSND